MVITSAPVLILDKTYAPVKVGKTKDAICALFSGKAQVIDQDYNLYDFYEWCEFTKQNKNNENILKRYSKTINSPKFSLFVPHTIYVYCMQESYLKGKKKTLQIHKERRIKRDNLKCQYCGKLGTK